MSRSTKAHLLLVLISLIWGSTFVLVKKALNDSSPLVLNTLRMALAAVLLAIFYRKKMAALTRPALIAGMVVGFFLYAGYAFQTTGLKLTTPSKSAFLTGTSTVMVPLLLVAIWRTRIHWWRVVGIALGILGLFLMTTAVNFFQEQKITHVYLGTCYSERALYKTQFAGLEFFNGFRWSQNLDELKYQLRRDHQKHLLETEEFRAQFYDGDLKKITAAGGFNAKLK